MSKHCCDRMDADLDQTCDIHPNRHECPDNLVAIVRGGYGLIVHDGGGSVIEIAFCPWCGAKLPPIADLSSDDEDPDNEERDERPPQSRGTQKLGPL